MARTSLILDEPEEVVCVEHPLETMRPEGGRGREIAAILVMASGLLAIVSLHSVAAGIVGYWLARLLRWSVGLAADIPPLFFVAIGFIMLRGGAGPSTRRRLGACFMLLLALLVVLHLRALGPHWSADWGPMLPSGQPGGMVGSVLGGWALAAFGWTGSLVVIGAVCVIAMVLLLEVRLAHVIHRAVSVVVRVFAMGLRALAGLVAGTVSNAGEVSRNWREYRARRRALQQAEAVARRPPHRTAHAPVEPPRREQPRGVGFWAEGAETEKRGIGHRLRGAWQVWLERRRSSETEKDALADGAVETAAAGVARRETRLSTPSLGMHAAEEFAPGPTDEPDRAEGRRRSRTGVDPEYDSNKSADPVARPEPRFLGPAPRPRATVARQQPPGEPAPKPVVPSKPQHYQLPPVVLLEAPRQRRRPREEPDQTREMLVRTLKQFGVDVEVVGVSTGPVITRYEVRPAEGVRVNRIAALADDLALALAAAGVRIEAPIPGKAAVGIEVPNRETTMVYLREVLESPAFTSAKSKLCVGLGKDIGGNPVVVDLSKLPHLLIAGATGSGKSVCVNTIISSLLFRAQPTEVKMIMIDPKRVELSVYEGIPHLLIPVVTDPNLAANALRWAVKEMERRYKLLEKAQVRNFEGFNAAVADGRVPDEVPLPYIVVIVDELADLMMVAGKDVEDSICRLAQKARAAGIHLIIATQRPSVDVITGLIKANIPSRLSFAVTSAVDSRTILDHVGAERLLGKGDMLFHPTGAPKPLRAQGANITDREVQDLVEFWRRQGEPEYQTEVLAPATSESDGEAEAADELFADAVRLVVESGQASISLLQRRFRIGYSRAARLIDMMELRGIVGASQGSKPREVLKRLSEVEEMLG